MDEITGIRIDVETIVPAKPEIVWDLVADVMRVPRWSPECVHTAWLDESGSVRTGARFTARNHAQNGAEWTVTCVITEVERPRAFAWTVLGDPPDLDMASSFWRYDLEPTPSNETRVRESFIHGPGPSGLRSIAAKNPDRASQIIEGRKRRLRDNMLHTLDGMRTAALQL